MLLWLLVGRLTLSIARQGVSLIAGETIGSAFKSGVLKPVDAGVDLSE